MEYGGEVWDSHVGGDVAGGDPVHLDVVLAPLVAEGLGQLAERTLRGRVGWHGETALEGRERAAEWRGRRREDGQIKKVYCPRASQWRTADRELRGDGGAEQDAGVPGR